MSSDLLNHSLRLAPGQLCTPCNPDHLSFVTTEELPDLTEDFAHPRAVEALNFGLDIRRPGYNLFVLGDPGSGRHALVHRLVRGQADGSAALSDWCYVNNFEDAARPRLLKLPAGRGAALRQHMQDFVAQLGPAISTAFESDNYRARIDGLQEEYKQKEEGALREMGRESLAQGVALVRTPEGFMFVPAKDKDETYSQEEFEQLPAERQKELEGIIDAFEDRLNKLVAQFPRWHRELQDKIKETSREAMRLAVGHEIEELEPLYADLPEVAAFLDGVLHDVVETGDTLRESQRPEGEMETLLFSGSISIQRYLVNLLVDNGPLVKEGGQTEGSEMPNGRPLICESLPTFPNLLGRVEHISHMGTLVSNFTLIKAGALHKANGGTLVLEAAKLLTQPFAWEGLKRALQSGLLRLEAPGDLYGMPSIQQLEPEPIPLEVKVVLIGDRSVYYLLAELDPEFTALFKVAADLETEVERSADNTNLYARLLATLARRNGIKPLARDAVARVIEHAARLAEDAQRLTTRTRLLADLLREADWWAQKVDSPAITRLHVEQALTAILRRADRVREKQHEAILRGSLLIATDGSQIGQINGLAAMQLGDYTFAQPSRITAAVRMGEGEVVDIERETELGGPLHSKGVFILNGFMAARFGRGIPLSLNASLVFEQSYGEVEGDSASLAELCALLSAIALLPLRQSLAMTGSVNQLGAVQPIGAVNEKIEGFFDVCQARGLTGEQGVIIPRANVPHLMLRQEVVEAVAAGRFHVFAVNSVDQAMELLTGVAAGEVHGDGEVPADSVNGRVATQLAEMALRRHTFGEERPQPPKRTRSKKAAKETKEVPPKPGSEGPEPPPAEPPAN